LKVTKFVDLSSPEILMGQVEGRVYSEAILTSRKSGENPFEFLVIKFTNVQVTAVSTGGAVGEGPVMEKVSLNFERARYEYTRQNPDGSSGEITAAEIFPSSRCK
jgi:type VI secretion system secreted protein Hcp